jgi:hypothetical protein
MSWLLAFAGPALSIAPLMMVFNPIAGQCGIGAAVRSNHRATVATSLNLASGSLACSVGASLPPREPCFHA